MKSFAKLTICLIATLWVGLASAQTTSPNAYVYVISNPSTNTYELRGYKADATGALTPLSATPLWRTTTRRLLALAHTAHWLFVSDQANIYSFSISSNGGLKFTSSVNAAKYYGFFGETGVNLALDHTGATLYALAIDGSGDNEFQFFNKNSTTGALSFIGSSGSSAVYSGLIFTGTNQFAYGLLCFLTDPVSYGFKRGADGSLTRFNPVVPFPTNPDGRFCPVSTAANPTNNLAVAMYLDSTTQRTGPVPPGWLAVYSVDASGNLTTKSTATNMPRAGVGGVSAMVASAPGNLLAVAGEGGLQIFHFNGSNPITPYTGLLATHSIQQILWDTHDHLYGISPSSGRLYAFKITTTGHKQAAGSPYSVPNPVAITVLSK